MTFVSNKYRGSQLYLLVYCRLIQAAQQSQTIYYDEIRIMMGLKPGNNAAKEVGWILGEISEEEHSLGRPMLSVVVVNQQNNMSSEGFYVLAHDLGKFTGTTDQDKANFWNSELQAVYAIW